jgi:transposase
MRPKGTKQELEARRMHAVGLLEKGHGVREVGRRVGATPGAVWRWKEMYAAAGKEGLRAKPHPGAKPKLSAGERQRLTKLLARGPRAHGFSTELWTLSRVAEVIRRRFGVGYHPSQVWRILRALGWSCQKPERRARERDEEAIAQWRQVEWPRIKKGRAARAGA